MVDPDRLDFGDIPDPAAAVARRPLPAAPPPPSEASPTRAARAALLRLGGALALAWLVALSLRIGLRTDLDAITLVKIAAWVGAGVVIAWLVRPRTSLGPGSRVLHVAVVALPVAFAAIAALTARGDPDAGLAPSALFACASAALALAAGPVAFVALVARRAFVVNPLWRGAALGALGGFLGSVAIQTHCPVEACAHVLLAHGAPLVLGALLGAAFGARYGDPGRGHQ